VQVIATVKPGGDPGAVEKALNEEMASFLRSGPTREELERVKTSRYASFVRSVERIDGFVGTSAILGESQIYGGSPDFYKQTLRWTRDATAADIRNCAQTWLSDGVLVLNVEPFPEYHAAASGCGAQQIASRGGAARIDFAILAADNPTFPEQELNRLKARSFATIQQDKSDPRDIAFRPFPRLV
jgi:zinc protease